MQRENRSLAASLGLLSILAACLVLGGSACAPSGRWSSPSLTDEGTRNEPLPAGAQPSELDRQILVTVVQERPIPLRGAGSSRIHYVAGDTYSRTERSRRLSRQIARDHGLRQIEAWPIRVLGVSCVVFEIAPTAKIDQVLRSLEQDERVESAQRMQVFRPLALPHNDPYAELQTSFEQMHMGDVHRWAQGRGVRIAVIDTGVDRSHRDLAHGVRRVRDFVGATASDLVPAERHGTAMAGVIVSTPNNGLGMVGVAPEAELLALRACWESGPAGFETGRCSSFTLAKALAFLVEEAPQVLNLSLAGPSDPLLERLLAAALGRGIAVVGAYDETAERRQFPATVDGVLVVQALSRASPLDDASHFLYAPGRDVLTTLPGGSFDFVSGSSVAAAHVTGLLALLLEHDGSLDPQALAEVLRGSAQHAADASGRSLLRIDACAAVQKVHRAVRCTPHREPSPDALRGSP